MVNRLLEVTINCVITFIVLLIATRMVGRRQVAESSFFNYAAGLTMGTLAGRAIAPGDDFDGLEIGLASVVIWTILTIITSWFSFKSRWARVVVNSTPEYIIRNGQIIPEMLRKHRLSVDDVDMLLRTNKVFALAEVDFAIYEQNGTLSVMLKPMNQPLTKSDMAKLQQKSI